jgi:hypothetical protein
MDVLTAAFNVAEDYRPGGAAGLALAIDKVPTTLSHEVKGTGGAKLGLATAVKMTKASGDLRILLAFAAECGQMCVPLPESLDLPNSDVMRALAASAMEFAQLAESVCESLSDDGNINDNELRRIEREGAELLQRVQQLMATVQAKNTAGKAGRGAA